MRAFSFPRSDSSLSAGLLGLGQPFVKGGKHPVRLPHPIVQRLEPP